MEKDIYIICANNLIIKLIYIIIQESNNWRLKLNNNILDRKRLTTSIIFKAVSFIASVYGLIFTIDSIMSFTFFTTLSNVALDIVLAVFIVLDVMLLVTGKDYKNNGLYMLKFLMTLSITLTCLVYMIILGPTSDDGLIGAYLHN